MTMETQLIIRLCTCISVSYSWIRFRMGFWSINTGYEL